MIGITRREQGLTVRGQCLGERIGINMSERTGISMCEMIRINMSERIGINMGEMTWIIIR